MDPSDLKPGANQASEDSSAPLFLIEKVIDIFGWVVKFVLFVGFVAVFVYAVITVVIIITPLLQRSSVPPVIAQPVMELMNTTLDKLSPVLAEFWNLLKPILQLLIIVVLLRWLFFSGQGPLAGQLSNLDTPSLVLVLVVGALVVLALLGLTAPPVLSSLAVIVVILLLIRSLLFSQEGRRPGLLQNLLADVPSAIAVLVIGTIALITVLDIDIPDPLANIALVIVGFYFGQERLRKPVDEGLANSKKPEAGVSTTENKEDAAS